jgi:hypothetical protein
MDARPAPVARWQQSRRTIWPTAARPCRPWLLGVAAPLPRSVPDVDRGVIYEFAIDRVYIKIDGRLAYLWCAVDAEGEVLDVLVQGKRDKRAALKLTGKLLKKLNLCQTW